MKYLLLYLEETYGLTNEKKIDNAIGIVANENKYHPIRDYLNTLVWDGTERIRFCLRHFLGADADDYTYEALKLFLLGAISRAFQPGCKFEIMLCLVGGQGAGKSTFFRLLAVRDEWFSDDLRKLDDDNVYRKLQGHWIIEMSEMMATANAKSIEEIKSFLSRQKEVYKIPYETHPADRPRQCVFGGTSNALDFLPLDRSGNRRFIPVMVYPEQAEVHILEDEAASRAYIEQMWAEAMEIYRSGRFKLAFSPAMQRYLKEHQRDFMPEDTKAGMIQAYLDKYTGSMVCSKQLYKEALNHAFDELASSLSGNVPNYEAFMEALRRSAPVPITFEAMSADTDGYFSADHQKIAIRQGMSEVQTVSATVHEIAHSKLHDPKKYEMLPSWKVVLESEGGTKHDFKLDFATEKEAEQFASDMDWRYVDENQFEWRLAVEEDATAEKQVIKNRHTEEVEAESISYAVCKYFGIETGENSFGYIASWSQGKELKELRASLETINKTSDTLISDIERHYKEICKERGIDPHAKAEPETAPIEQPTGNLTYYVAECMEFSNLGEYHDNLSLEEAVRIYQEIPAERMNGIKGIGFELKDGSDYEGPFPILTGQTIDLDTIQAIDYYRDNPLVQKAVKELAAAMPEMEVLGADANQQEALFLIKDATYLHIQPCDSGWDYTLYDAASMKELDGGQLDMPELSCMKAVLQICDDNDLDSTSLRRAPLSMVGTVPEQLEKLYQQFNLEKPADFHSPSMSVSDIVAIRQDGKVSCHYCDSVGFTQIPGFLPENPLKNAEMTLEDDYGMIDGIINNGAKEPTVAELEQQARSGQPISLMELAAATHREEREKKKSVMEQLKGQPKTEHKKTAPKKSAEREI
ncbi:VapE domain-containing protein [Blautia wexlerae]